MRHVDDGTLRRMQDEPLIVTDSQRRHLEGCGPCRDRFASIEANAREARALWGCAPEATSHRTPAFDATSALTRFHRERSFEMGTQPARRIAPWFRSTWAPRRGRRLKVGAGGVAAAAALVGALTLTPAGSLAQTFITIFQPKQVAPVFVTSADLSSLPKLAQYGKVHAPTSVQPTKVADASAATRAAGMTVLVPGSLPSGVPSTVTYQVVPSATGTFTFNAATAKRTLHRLGKRLPSMPAGVNGSTLRITTGTAVAARYGSSQGIPALVVGQMVAPKVTSTGVTVKQLEDYVLSLPGVSRHLADAIRAVGDPTSTLPIPIPVDMAHADQVTIQGASGLAIGDSTGAGSAAIWEKGGIIYGVAGPLTESQVLDVADSLH